MKFGICELSYIPLRAGMSHTSEMVSQVLFGEVFSIVLNKGNWVKISLLHDNYEGWIEEVNVSYVEEKELSKYLDFDNNPQFTLELIKNEDESLRIPLGAKLNLNEDSFDISNNTYRLKSRLEINKIDDKRESLLRHAISMLNTPYLWGGRTEWGIDCSGFSQLLYRLIGINIPRDASRQVTIGNTLNFISESKPGDLAFFDNENGEITHVGILLSNTSIIHASKFVRIDTIDHQGIYNKCSKRYTHKLRIIKSIL